MHRDPTVSPAPPAVATINGTDLQVVRYKGAPVATFAQIDSVHRRVDGTAGRTYRENRDRFVEGDDFIEIDQPDEIRRLGFERPQGGTPAKVVLVTRRGYLKLVKSLNDDIAWSVFDEMVERYFVVERIAAPQAKADQKVDIREARLTFAHFHRLARLMKLEGNQALLAANQGTMNLAGVDMLGAMGMQRLVAPQNETTLTPSTVGKQIGLGVRTVNEALTRFGYQRAFRDAKGKLVYEPTEKGRVAGGVMMDTGKRHHTGTPVRQLVWASGVVDRLRSDLASEAA